MLKIAAKKLLNSWGFALYNTKYLPFGCDYKEDINRLSPNLKVEIIFDVGANSGQSALHYRQKFPQAKIYSFEPVARTFQKLQAATSKDTNIFCYQLALADRDGQEEIVTTGTKGTNSLKAKAALSSSLENDQTVELFTLTKLDSFLENNLVNIQYIDILKIDTEGFEIPVLQGALNTLKAGKIRYIFAETTLRDNDKDHTNFFELKKFLEPYNFNPIGFYDLVPYWGGGNAINYLNVLFKRWDNQS